MEINLPMRLVDIILNKINKTRDNYPWTHFQKD